MFRIDRHIPIPTMAERLERRSMRLPYKDMKVGDSFFVPGENSFRKVLESSRQHMKRHPGKFVVLPVFEDGEWGARCWREE